MIIYTEKIPSMAQMEDLYGAVGWIAYTHQLSTLGKALENSVLISAWQEDELLGFVRGVTDQTTILFIQDLLVFPKYQREGIGRELVERLMKKYPVGQTVLITDDSPATNCFYEAIGLQDLSKNRMKAFYSNTRII
ncbi:GNAT family N-acetyltransferase [Oenococcus sp.]|uniref:GNAT family N-acetyltransferase n=1 Tax=Oenococcus sp. TaxID=1979414 RepID=UPI0039EAEA48